MFISKSINFLDKLHDVASFKLTSNVFKANIHVLHFQNVLDGEMKVCMHTSVCMCVYMCAVVSGIWIKALFLRVL